MIKFIYFLWNYYFIVPVVLLFNRVNHPIYRTTWVVAAFSRSSPKMSTFQLGS